MSWFSRSRNEHRVSALPDSVHRLDIPGLFLVLPEDDLEHGLEAAAAAADAISQKGRLYAGAQGRFVIVPGASSDEMTTALEAAKSALRKARRPALVIGMFGDLATWAVASANLPAGSESEVNAVVAEIDRIRRMAAG